MKIEQIFISKTEIMRGMTTVKLALGKEGKEDVWARLIGAIPLKTGMSLD